MQTHVLLGIPLHSLSREKLAENFQSSLRGKTFKQVATVNPEFLVAAKKSADFSTLLQKKTWLNLCDGAGIQFLSWLLYGKRLHRISGVDTALLLCKICEQEKKSVYLLGGFGVAKKSADFLQSQFPNLKIAGTEDGDPTKLSPVLKKVKPDAILVAFGAPAQEQWLQKFGPDTGAKIGIGVGGTFDFWAEKLKRAPQWMQILGIEWVWRLIQEPKRWPRILTAVVVFPTLVVMERIRRFF